MTAIHPPLAMPGSDAPTEARVAALQDGLRQGLVVPFLGSGLVTLAQSETSPMEAVPDSVPALAEALTARIAVPGRIRHNLWSSAQYIESHHHRVTLKRTMAGLFAPEPAPSGLHRFLAGLAAVPMIVDLWYDDLMARALEVVGRKDWGQLQAVSRAEHHNQWVQAFDAAGTLQDPEFDAGEWKTVLYKPWGSVRPEGNFLVADSDFVEVLTEIDIQTPIPDIVQQRRTGRSFLFLGCRFNDQTLRIFARQIAKRSDDRHFAVLPGEITKNEQRYLDQQNIERIDMTLDEFARLLAAG